MSNETLAAEISPPSFAEFFRELWGYDPFPWQAMLAERVAGEGWPRALDLPTAAGKTACIDVAIYGLAIQAHLPLHQRTAPRRIWFVVDRRIVVDEANERALRIKEKLAHGEASGALRWVADRLCQLSQTKRPLAVGRLRGGVLRDDRFARLPSQPAVITSTVDQIGSRLLFRSYGGSARVAPIHAGLAANDSLILLDEAHCSVPFMQTLRRVEQYRRKEWAEAPLKTPFACAILSATPPPEIPASARFPGEARAEALNHSLLKQRLGAPKPADLTLLKATRGAASDSLVTEAANRAVQWVKTAGRRRAAVIVNRVKTAGDIAARVLSGLGREGEREADVVLLTGRLRPLERDALTKQWKPYLRADRPEEPPRPIVFVSTQAIEVGADFSFDALVTECASLDALRQRFGRLNRLGLPGAVPAVVLAREEQVEEGADDPIYGESLRHTWQLLLTKSSTVGESKTARHVLDFGFESLHSLLSELDDETLGPCLAPRPDAPVLLPAHLDLLCQTAPTPHPDPDVSKFLHGSQGGVPEARVIWRADLLEESPGLWLETVSLCPPVSTEAAAVSLPRLRRWLAQESGPEVEGDVEGRGSHEKPERARGHSARPFIRWRGRDGSRVDDSAEDLRPGDLVVVPASYTPSGLTQTLPDSPEKRGLGPGKEDLWEWAHETAGRPRALRIQRALWHPWLDLPAVLELVKAAEKYDGDREPLWELIDLILTKTADADSVETQLPSWLRESLAHFRGRATRDVRIDLHPAGGLIISDRRAFRVSDNEQDLFADDDDIASSKDEAVELNDHAAQVGKVLENLAVACLPPELCETMRIAAAWHDAGKLDERFQLLLRGGSSDEVATLPPLAKSASLPLSREKRDAFRAASGMPMGFRHEMLSAQLAERFAPLPSDDDAAALALHLIASHHGHARPFAPVVPDRESPAVSGPVDGVQVEISAEERKALPSPHRADSGIPERFWMLTRRYGWWGLAYLETIMRLADWYASEFPQRSADSTNHEDA